MFLCLWKMDFVCMLLAWQKVLSLSVFFYEFGLVEVECQHCSSFCFFGSPSPQMILEQGFIVICDAKIESKGRN